MDFITVCEHGFQNTENITSTNSNNYTDTHDNTNMVANYNTINNTNTNGFIQLENKLSIKQNTKNNNISNKKNIQYFTKNSPENTLYNNIYDKYVIAINISTEINKKSRIKKLYIRWKKYVNLKISIKNAVVMSVKSRIAHVLPWLVRICFLRKCMRAVLR